MNVIHAKQTQLAYVELPTDACWLVGGSAQRRGGWRHQVLESDCHPIVQAVNCNTSPQSLPFWCFGGCYSFSMLLFLTNTLARRALSSLSECNWSDSIYIFHFMHSYSFSNYSRDCIDISKIGCNLYILNQYKSIRQEASQLSFYKKN